MHIDALLDAPRRVVWQAWADPAQIVQWWGPNGSTNTMQTFDLREGGEWRFTMHGPDGKDYLNKSECDTRARIQVRTLKPALYNYSIVRSQRQRNTY